MNIQSINGDIKLIEQAIGLIEKTENYLHFRKSHLVMELCEQVNVLKEKRDRQIQVINQLT